MKRHTVAGVFALALTALPGVASTPAHAVTAMMPCQTVPGPTPAVDVHMNKDLDPEYRVPSVSNVSVCGWGTAIADAHAAVLEPCSTSATCVRMLISPQAGASLESDLQVCRAVDGVYTCSTVHQPQWSVMTPEQDTLCVAVNLDLYGSYPCDGGLALVAFE